MTTTTTRGAIEMTAAMAISGTIGAFVLFSNQPVIDVVFWRCVFGAVPLLIACVALGLFRRDTITPRQFLLATLGGVAIVANWLLLFAAYPRASISIATAVYNTQPFMLVAFGVLFLGERLTAHKLGWLAIAFAGVVLIANGKTGSGGSDYLGGILLSLGAAFFYAIAALVTKQLRGIPPHLIALIQVGVGMLMAAPFAGFSSLPTSAATWGSLAAIGVVHTGLVYILLYGAIQKLPTPLIGALSFIYPVVAILVDFIVFGHRLGGWQLLGAAAILVAAAAMTLGWEPFGRRMISARWPPKPQRPLS
ncbi:Permease of the drug/metabolite transporter (DMT) superfamily protein [Devosia sp. LC5]|uniref:DMT family transporter n=1 Tax=Devosia sp. LC5 TaxID=1502724 RepID=UPI0004E3A9E4|nr:DMT family transporter [Devosia sp. LC5]KFC67343.1 Permease of the drug/metabolite transporter (DMT) superfamily protein [Devosia sp. LC5]